MTQAEQLLDRIANDPAFRQSLEVAPDPAARRAILTGAGFGNVTKEDIEAYATSHGQELSDAELEAVAGGKTTSWASVIISLIGLAIAA
jgi:predicted ribosomally synthesized peptide with nif11-like leader